MSAGAWHPDPTGRFAQRYHDGQNWTDHVADASGTQQSDPFSQPDASPAAPPGPSSPPPPSEAMTASTYTAATPTTSSLEVTPALIVAGIGLIAVLISMFGLGWVSVSMSAGPESFNESFDRSDVNEAVNDAPPADLTGGFGLASSSLPEANAPTKAYLSFGWVLALLVAAGAVAASFASQLRLPIAAACGVAAVWHLVALLGAASHIESLLDSTVGGAGIAATMLNLNVSVAIGGWIGLIGRAMGAVGAFLAKPQT